MKQKKAAERRTKGWYRRAAQRQVDDHERLRGRTSLTWVANGSVMIHQHQGITEYGDSRITVKGTCGRFCVCGEGLRLEDMDRDTLCIAGRVQQIEHQSGKGGTL